MHISVILPILLDNRDDRTYSKFMIYGTLHIHRAKDPFEVLDQVRALGINRFDCGTVYGPSESILGEWIKSRNIPRDELCRVYGTIWLG